MIDRGLGVSLVPDWPLSWPAGHALVRKALPHPFASRHVRTRLVARDAARTPRARAARRAEEAAAGAVTCCFACRDQVTEAA